MTKSTVYAVGETVFDIIFRDYQPAAASPGGSSFNAAITLGRLGVPVSFISEVGNDRIGNHIKKFLTENGVENGFVMQPDGGKTALSLAFLDKNNDASYDFYKDYPAQRLESGTPPFLPDDYLLFGSFYGLNPVLRPRMKQIIAAAREAGSVIYYDPNFRSSHLSELQQLQGIIVENFRDSSVVRASDEDMRNIYNVGSAEEAWREVSKHCDYFIYTANASGIHLFTPGIHLFLTVDRIEPVSTIGAGDTFNAGMMYGFHRWGITRERLGSLTEEEWGKIIQAAAHFSKEVCLSYENYISPEVARKFRDA